MRAEWVRSTFLTPAKSGCVMWGVGPTAVVLTQPGNWEADDEKWSGPLLFDVSKVTKLGQWPTKFKVAAGPSFGPAEGPEWRFRFAATFLFPR